MKSLPTGPGQSILASQANSERDDSRGAGFLLPHQQLGSLSLSTNPTAGQTVNITINGTSIIANFVSSIGTYANNILIGASATATVTNLLNWLRRPDLTTSTQVAASAANQGLLQYAGWAWPGSSTTVVPFSLNKNVNGNTDILASFTISTTVTSGSWTAQAMQLYIESGPYYVGNTRVLFNGGSTPTFTAPVTYPRIDLVTADSTGTLALVTGTENASPATPTYPSNKVVICEVYHVVGETGIYDNDNQQSGQGYIYNDVRPTLLLPYINSLSQVAPGLFIPDPGSEVQGNILYYNGSAWVLLPPGSAGNVLTTEGGGANPQWIAPNAKVSFDGFTDTAVSVPTGNVETSVESGTVVAMGANSSLLIKFKITTPGAASVVVGLQLNGTDLLTIPSGTAGVAYLDIVVSNRNSTSAQIYQGYYLIGTTQTFISGTASISLGSNFTLSVTGKQNSGGSATFTVNQLFVLPING